MSEKRLLLLILLFFISLYTLPAQTLRKIPYSDPVYPFLDKAYSLGWLAYLPQIRPYSVAGVLEWLEQIDRYSREHPGVVTPLARSQAESFRERLLKPVHHLKVEWEGSNYASLDFPLSFSTNSRLENMGDSYLSTGQSFSGEISFGDSFFLGMDNWSSLAFLTYERAPFRKFYRPLREDYAIYNYFLSQGTGKFSHSQPQLDLHTPGEADLFLQANSTAQTTINFDIAELNFGRESLSWGPSPLCNLSLSSWSKPYEYLQLDIPLSNRGTFTWMTGVLQDFIVQGEGEFVKKLVNVHRVEIQLVDWLLFALTESVVYSYRLELAYLNPISLYYLNEVRLGDNDNKLVGFDLVFRLPHSKAYLAVLVDDWDFGEPFSLTYFHNEMGALLGVQLYDLLPDVMVHLEYAYMSHWMYTHKTTTDPANSYNRYKHYDSHLGHFLNPNAHMIYLEIARDHSLELSYGTSLWFTQDGKGTTGGEGTIDDPLTPNVSSGYLDFLDGTVESNLDWTLFAEYRLLKYNAVVKAAYTLAYTKNLDKVAGRNQWDNIFSLEFSWMTY